MSRLARSADGTALLGNEEGYVPLAAADPSLNTVQDALTQAAQGTLPSPTSAPATPIAPEEISFAAPLEQYGKLWGIGLNYAEHATDLDEDHPDEPASFMKPASAATGPAGPIRLPDPAITERVTAEAELAVVLGRTCRDVSPAEASDMIAGYVPVIDMTAEDILEQNPRYLTRSKSFDTFLVFGQSILTTDEIDDLDSVCVRTIVNDETIAENAIENMRHPPETLVSVHSEVMTLEPGDVISTGTPGAAAIEPGNQVTAAVDDVGTVSADVVDNRN